jgi:hypothetical protein
MTAPAFPAGEPGLINDWAAKLAQLP